MENKIEATTVKEFLAEVNAKTEELLLQALKLYGKSDKGTGFAREYTFPEYAGTFRREFWVGDECLLGVHITVGDGKVTARWDVR